MFVWLYGFAFFLLFCYLFVYIFYGYIYIKYVIYNVCIAGLLVFSNIVFNWVLDHSFDSVCLSCDYVCVV